MSRPPPLDRWRRLGHDGALSLLAWLVPLLTTFITTPAIVRLVGSEKYGIYCLFSGFAIYALTLACGRALVRFSPLIAEDPAVGCRQLLPTAIAIAMAAGVVNCLIIAIFGPWMLGHAVEGAFYGFVIVCLVISVSGINVILAPVLQIAGRLPLAAFALFLSGVLWPTGAFCVVKLGGGWIGLLAWQLTVAIALFAILTTFVLRVLPSAPPKAIERYWQWKVVGLAAGAGFVQMLGNGLAIAERVVLGLLSRPEAVTHYVLAFMIVLLMHAAVAHATTTLPVLASAGREGDRQQNLKVLYLWAMRHVLSVVVFAMTVLIVGGPAFVILWLGDVGDLETAAALRWLAPAMAIYALLVIPWCLAETQGMATANLILASSWLLIALPLAVFLIPRLGAEGMAIARLVSMAGAPVYFIYVERRLLGHFQADFWLGSLVRLLFAAGAAAVIMHLLLRSLPLNWLALCLAASTAFSVFVAALFALGQIKLSDLSIPAYIVGGRGMKRSEPLS